MPPSPRETTILLIRKDEFQDRSASSRWSDPNGIASVSDKVRAVLLSNPSLGQNDVIQLVGLKDASVIGSTISIKGRMIVEGDEHPVHWASYLSVDPSARKTMLAFKLVKAFEELCPTSAVCGVSQAGYALYKGIGWTDFEMPRHILLCHSQSVLEKKVGGSLSRCLRIPVDWALQAYNWRLLRPQSRRIEWHTSNEVPQELVHRLATSPANRRNVFFARTEQTVRWQLNSCVPAAPGDCNFLVTFHAGGSLVGYAGARLKFFPVASAQGFRNVRLGSLYDWMIFDGQQLSFRDLVACACRELIARGADGVELCATNATEDAALRSMRLPRVGTNHLLWKAAKGSVLDDARFRDRERWTIRPGDADLFM